MTEHCHVCHPPQRDGLWMNEIMSVQCSELLGRKCIHTHTRTHMYIRIYVYMYMFVYITDIISLFPSEQ